MEVELREYDDLLSNKRPNLSAPGTRTTSLYYSSENSSVEVLESTCDWSNKISLTSLQFGGSNQVNMPMSAFIGQLILHLRVPNLLANQSLCRGWGLRMIRQIRFQFGTSASTPIILTQQAIWHALMAQCHTEEKRSYLLKLCGQEYLLPQVALPGEEVPTLDAYVPIPIPFSTICEKLMYDSTILGQPITVFIDFEENARVVYGGSATPPTSFDVAEMLVRQQRLSDQSKSLKNILQADPSMMYSYPFIMALGYETNGPFEGKRAVDGVVNVQLNQFQNSDLLGIVVSVQKVTDVNPVGFNSPNPFHLDDVYNINMTYNGASIFQWPAKSYKAIATYMGGQQASFYQGSYIDAKPAGTNPFISNPVDESLIFFDFTQERSACLGQEMQNSWRIPPGNVLNLSFNTTLGAGTQYRCFYTCFYNSIVVAQSGTSNIFTS